MGKGTAERSKDKRFSILWLKKLHFHAHVSMQEKNNVFMSVFITELTTMHPPKVISKQVK